MKETSHPQALIQFIEDDFSIGELDHGSWKKTSPYVIERYWNGEAAPEFRRATAWLLWSASALYAKFEAHCAEPLTIHAAPNLETKSIGLWDRDVCEIFIAPDKREPRRYFEFEAAPNGEWLDLAVDSTSGTREVDWDYASGIEVRSEIRHDSVVTAFKLEWRAFGKTPSVGEVWLGNLFRCVGRDPDRGYLAWSPTMTERPNFHVPERFGQLKFVR